MPRRRVDWERQLIAFIDATRDAPFQYGEQDCGLWALRCADAMCDTHCADDLLWRYGDEAGIRALFAARGWQDTTDAVRAYFGEPLRLVSHAQRGDMVTFPPRADTPFSTVTIMQLGSLIGPGLERLVTYPLRVSLLMPGAQAFAVGR
jgi:hypothetical protein